MKEKIKDAMVTVILPAVVLIIIIYKFFPDVLIPTLVNNPCAPGYSVYVNGEFMKCSHHEQSPANMWVPE